jgi:hypothetical protein
MLPVMSCLPAAVHTSSSVALGNRCSVRVAGPMLQGLAGTSAASNAASNTGSSAATAVSSAVASLGQTLGKRVTTVSDVRSFCAHVLHAYCHSMGHWVIGVACSWLQTMNSRRRMGLCLTKLHICLDCIHAPSNRMQPVRFPMCCYVMLSVSAQMSTPLCLALQIQVQLQELLLQFCSAEVFTPPTKVREPVPP